MRSLAKLAFLSAFLTLGLFAQTGQAQDLVEGAPTKSVQEETSPKPNVNESDTDTDEREESDPKTSEPKQGEADALEPVSEPVNAKAAKTESNARETPPIPLFADVPLPLRWQQNAAGKNPQVSFGQNGEVRSASGDALFFHSPRTGAVTQRLRLGCSIIGLADDFVLCEKTLFRVNRFGEKTVQARFQKSATSFAVFGDDHAVVFKDGGVRLERYGGNPLALSLPANSAQGLCFDKSGEGWTLNGRGPLSLTGDTKRKNEAAPLAALTDKEGAYVNALSGRRYVQLGSATFYVDDNRQLPSCARAVTARVAVHSLAANKTRVLTARAKGPMWFYATDDDALRRTQKTKKRTSYFVSPQSLFYGGAGVVGIVMTPILLSAMVPNADAFSTSFQSGLLLLGSTTAVVGGVLTALGGYGLYVATAPSDLTVEDRGPSCMSQGVARACQGFVSALCCAVGAPTLVTGVILLVGTPLLVGGALALDPNQPDLPFSPGLMNAAISLSSLGAVGASYAGTLYFRDKEETLSQTALKEPVRLFFAVGVGTLAAAGTYGLLHLAGSR